MDTLKVDHIFHNKMLCIMLYAIQFIINNHTACTVNSTKQLQKYKTIFLLCFRKKGPCIKIAKK